MRNRRAHMPPGAPARAAGRPGCERLERRVLMAATPVVTGFTLIDADADAPVPGVAALADGAVLDLAALPTRRLNVRADVGTGVGSVRFGYDAAANFRVENAAPFALASNDGADYFAWTPTVGRHTVAATPFGLANAGGDAGGTYAVTFTVVDGDPGTSEEPEPPVVPANLTTAASDADAGEPDGTGSIVVTRDGPTDADLVVNLTLSGTATETSDFEAVARTLTIPAGSASAAIEIRTIDDAVDEPSETVVLTLADGAGYTFSTSAASAEVVIADDDEPAPTPATVTIRTTDPNANEPGGTGTIQITRDGPLDAPLVVNLTLGGTATEGDDFQALPRAVTIPAGSASANVVVRVVDNTAVESPETVVLTLAAGEGYTFSPSAASAQVALGDNDTAPPPPPPSATVSIRTTDANANEPTGTGAIQLTRTGSTAAALAVNLTVGGTATEGSDFATLARTLTIPAGQASASVTIRALDDLITESPETVVLALASGAGYTFSSSAASALVTLGDNDVAGPFKATAAKVGTTGLALSWTAPAGEVVSYEVTYTPGAYLPGTAGQPKKVTVNAPAGGVTLSGLESFTLYSIDVAAINPAGGRQTTHVNAWTGEPAALRRYLYVVDAPKNRIGFEKLKPQIQVFDIENGHQWVKNIPLPKIYNIRGVAANAITDRLYISYHNTPVDNDAPGGLLCLNLNTGAVIWRRDYAESVIPAPDRFDLTPDGKKIYMPVGESGTLNDWAIIDASNGNIIGNVEHVTSPHNTIVSLDGRFAFLEGQEKGPQPAAIKNTIGVVDTATNKVVKTIGPFKAPVRPFTINGKASLVFATVNNFIGFQIGDVATGKVLYTLAPPGRVQPTSTNPFESFSHGISLTADEREVWVVDDPKAGFHVWDVSNVSNGVAPKYLKFVQMRRKGRNLAGAIDPAASWDVERAPRWMVPSYDGKYLYAEGGEIVDIASKQVVGQLRSKMTDSSGNLVWAPYTHSRFILEVQFDAGLAVRTTNQFGVGRVR